MSFNVDGGLEEGECVSRVEDTTMEHDNLQDFEDAMLSTDASR